MSEILMQVEEYLEYCEKVRRMSVATMVQKRNVLERFVEVAKIHDLGEFTNSVFNAWTAHEVMRGVSARSINMYNVIVIAMVRYYRGIEVRIPLNLSLVKKMKEGEVRRKFYAREEVERVAGGADAQTGLIIKIMFETGMRIAEVTKLRLGDIEGRRISFIGKGQKPREVYIKSETLEQINQYVVKNKVKDYLWGNYQHGGNGEPPTVETIRKQLKKAFRVAGYMDFYPHALRHSFATDLQLKGASVAEIKEMIGHESIATTERYLHGFEGRLKELFDRYR